MRLAGRLRLRLSGSWISSVPRTPVNRGLAMSPLYAEAIVENTSRDRCSTGMPTFSP
jgi:hypothetical protein